MSVVRLGATGLALAAVAAALLLLAGGPVAALQGLGRAPVLAASGHAEDVVLALTGLLVWAAWAWGALGVVLTAVSALPGLAGALARGVARALLPERLRTAAALALGIGLVVAGPAAADPGMPSGADDRATSVPGLPAPPDWPAAGELPAPPAGPAQRYVVVPGDCLWRIAEDHLDRSGPPPTDREVASAVPAWWSANADVIGPDPDVLHPGQVLQAPPPPTDSAGGSR